MIATYCNSPIQGVVFDRPYSRWSVRVSGFHRELGALSIRSANAEEAWEGERKAATVARHFFTANDDCYTGKSRHPILQIEVMAKVLRRGFHNSRASLGARAV